MPSPTYRAADWGWAQVYGLPLSDWLLDRYEATGSFQTVARELRDLTGGSVDVSDRTVATWVRHAQESEQRVAA